MAVEIEDERDQPEPVNIDLRMLRYRMECISRMNWELTKNHAVTVRTAEHSATSTLDIRDGRTLLMRTGATLLAAPENSAPSRKDLP